MPNNSQLNFHISGMHCASCASNIQRRLEKTEGVLNVSVNYANEQGYVLFDSKNVSQQEIVNVISSLGYTAHLSQDQDQDIADQQRKNELSQLKKKLVVSGVLTTILMMSMVPFMPSFIKNPWLLWTLTTPVQFWAGKRFYQGAWSGLKNMTANMDTLVALGTSVAYLYSVMVTVFEGWFLQQGLDTHVYFESSAAIITFILLGKYLEIKAKAQTSLAIKELLSLQAKTARVKRNAIWVKLPIEKVTKGDLLKVKPGEKIPVDGEITKGETLIDESMVTGESMPVTKKVKDTVIGATINQSGTIELSATKIGQETFLAGIVRSVKEAQGSKPAVQTLVDQVASVFAPVVIVLSFLTFIVWMIFGPEPQLTRALLSLINVLIIACPCALGLATPTSLMVGMGRAAQSGILIKDAQALEVASKASAIVFDKTGTLTEGKPSVVNIEIIGGKESRIKQFLWAVESQSHHPLAEAIVSYVEDNISEKKLFNELVTHFSDHPGKGVSAKVDGQDVIIGTLTFLKQRNVLIDANLQNLSHQWQEEAQTVVHLAIERNHQAIVGIADTLKKDAVAVVKELKTMNIDSYLVTGDNQQTAKAIAKQAGISHILAEVLPDEKKGKVEHLRRKHSIVAMVGDGINDAPALAAADIGIAMGGGTDVAIESAGVTLLRSDISLIITTIKLSQATFRNIQQNLFWAFAYNTILIPVAMGVMYPLTGLLLNPMMAGAAMAFSSVSVVGNALRLKRVTLK